MNYPNYFYPSNIITGLFRDIILIHHRNFREDAQVCIAKVTPPVKIICKENIPTGGGYIITINHYYRDGFPAQWMAIAISSVIPSDIHWIITGELTYPGKWYAPLGMAISKFILQRGARVYGFTTMPPMPPRAKDVEARAASVREVLNYVKQNKDAIIGLAPEGGDQVDGKLTMPASGVGRFALLFAAQGLRFEPVGVYESDGELCLHFGESYELKISHQSSADKKDSAAARILMEHIAPLLPEHLRGEFSSLVLQSA
jgi:hypothetical protein